MIHLLYKNTICKALCLTLCCFLLGHVKTQAQTLLFNATPVSDVGTSNNIGKANTSRNIGIDNNGNIYVVFSGSEGIRVAKSADRGASFSTSVQVSNITSVVEPSIVITDQNHIFIGWVEGTSIKLSKSEDLGLTFSNETIVGDAAFSSVVGENVETVHMSTSGNNIYISDRSGENIYTNACLLYTSPSPRDS